MNFKSSLDKAKHDLQASQLLLKNGNFNDWVIITAFYSALHFIHHSAFENQQCYDGNFKNFEDFYKKREFKKFRISKHRAVAIIAMECLGLDIKAKYQWLLDSGYSSRYRNNKFNKSDAVMAHKYLNEIQEKCCKSK